MPADIEEIVVPVDHADAEQFAPDLRQCAFGRALRGIRLGNPPLGVVGRGQRTHVDLAVGGERPGLHAHVGVGQHVVGQRGRQMAAQFVRVVRRHGIVLRADHIGDQTALPCRVIAHPHQRLVDLRMGVQRRFDLARFQPETANLALRIASAQAFEQAVGAPASQIAGPVHARSRFPAEGIGHELFGGQCRLSQIAQRQCETGDMQFALHADRQRLAMPVEHVQAQIADRLADRNALAVGWHVGDCNGGGELGGLGGAVGLQQRLRRGVAQQRGQRLRVGDVATGDQIAQRRQLARQLGCVSP